MRRIGLDDKSIISDFAAHMEKQNEDLMSYFCSYMALCSSLPPRGMIFHEGLRNSCNAIEYGDLRDNGMMEKIRFTRHMGVMPRNVDFKNVIEKMLVYIAI